MKTTSIPQLRYSHLGPYLVLEHLEEPRMCATCLASLPAILVTSTKGPAVTAVEHSRRNPETHRETVFILLHDFDSCDSQLLAELCQYSEDNILLIRKVRQISRAQTAALHENEWGRATRAGGGATYENGGAVVVIIFIQQQMEEFGERLRLARMRREIAAGLFTERVGMSRDTSENCDVPALAGSRS